MFDGPWFDTAALGASFLELEHAKLAALTTITSNKAWFERARAARSGHDGKVPAVVTLRCAHALPRRS